tara:strand:+ start:503 stop:706 length:204 start_codon:yes stop_codon:yes gene_type:complete
MLDDRQQENLGKFFIDIAKIIFAVFVIGGFVPNSSITPIQIILAIVESLALVVMGLYLIKRREIDNG